VQKKIIRLLGLQVICIFCLSLFSTFYFRQLYNDGANWAFLGLNQGSYHIDMPYWRFTTITNQIFFLLSMWAKASLPTSVWLFCLGYMIYPFIGIGLCTFFFRHSPNKKYLLIPVIVFFMCIVPSWTFSVSVVNEAVILGLINICYILSREKPKTWIILILGVLLNFSYEMGALFYPTMVYLLWREKKLNKVLLTGFILMTALQAYNLLIRLIPINAHSHVGHSFVESLNGIYFYLPLLLLFLLFDFGHKKWVRSLALTLIATFVYLILTYLYTQPSHYFWEYSYMNRVWTIPFSCLLCLLAYEFFKTRTQEPSQLVLAALALFFLPAIYLEWRVVNDSVRIAAQFKSVIANNQGCVVWNREEWIKFEKDSSIPVWVAPHMSLLFSQSFKPKTILFTDVHDRTDDMKIIPNNFCELHEGEIHIINDVATTAMQTNGRFDFSSIYKVTK
jgi:hypothetical protein